jgi:hypothetical protein
MSYTVYVYVTMIVTRQQDIRIDQVYTTREAADDRVHQLLKDKLNMEIDNSWWCRRPLVSSQ